MRVRAAGGRFSNHSSRDSGPAKNSLKAELITTAWKIRKKTIDAASERVRRTLKKAASFGNVEPSPITAEKVNFALTDIHFAGDEVAINSQAERFIREFCAGLLQDESSGDVKLCVLCLSSSGQLRDNALALAARRAKAVEDCLRANLPDTGKWSIYSWGAGADSIWTAGDTTVSTEPQVLIAILRGGG
jgi:outer membrane protein OmpA-like peptidoglycan-associated protein